MALSRLSRLHRPCTSWIRQLTIGQSRLLASSRPVNPLVKPPSGFLLPSRVSARWSGSDNRSAGEKESTVASLGRTLWKVVRLVFIVTGGVVWLFVWTSYMKADVWKSGMKKWEGENSAMKKRLMNFFDVGNAECKNGVKEFAEKLQSMQVLWDRLKEEDTISDSLGPDACICGVVFKTTDASAPSSVSKEEIRDQYGGAPQRKWMPSFYVQGPHLLGRLDTEFQLIDGKWVPLSAGLETMRPSGDRLVEVSGPPPNGLGKFTRLSKTK
eukprot:m.6200 g.6200  ORF g.6200 m.6200 type:complete len:269 (+) comp15293_c0_seq1:101-907(+)